MHYLSIYSYNYCNYYNSGIILDSTIVYTLNLQDFGLQNKFDLREARLAILKMNKMKFPKKAKISLKFLLCFLSVGNLSLAKIPPIPIRSTFTILVPKIRMKSMRLGIEKKLRHSTKPNVIVTNVASKHIPVQL